MALSTLLLVQLIAAVALQSTGQPLGRDQIVQLHKSGLDDRILIQQIQKDGIDFEVSAQDTLFLKNSGISNAVISAILSSSTSKSRAAVPPQPPDQIRSMYKEGKFTEVVGMMEPVIERDPADYRARSIVALAYLRLGERELARKQLRALREAGEPAKRYTLAVSDAFAAMEASDIKQAAIRKSLSDFDSKKALALISDLNASDSQKRILTIYILASQAAFNDALSAAESLPADRLADAQRRKAIIDEVKRNQEIYRKYRNEADVFLRSPIAASMCTPQYQPSMVQISDRYPVSRYLEVVGEMYHLTPLDPYTLNLAFHAQMLAGNVDTLTAFGDRVLNGSGELAIPFFSEDRFFDLVIDWRRKIIYTRDDPTPFSVQAVLTFAFDFRMHSGKVNGDAGKLVAFSIPLKDVTSIKQHAGRLWGNSHEMVRKAYALQLEPGGGTAPKYGLMYLLNCQGGEVAINHATYALGKYVEHLVESQGGHPSVELADPEKKVGHFGEALLSVVAAAYSTSLNPSSVGSNVEMVTDMANHRSEESTAAAQNWSALQAAQSVMLPDSVFEPIEKLVELI